MPDQHKHDHHEHDHSHSHDHHHHGHDHAHSHGHSHDHEHACDHKHDHEHGHSHEHTHEHTHAHEHEHGDAHAGSGTGGISEKTIALLSYMLTHNRDHTEELAVMAQELAQAGQGDAARLMEEGVRGFQAGNEKLAGALGIIRGEK